MATPARLQPQKPFVSPKPNSIDLNFPSSNCQASPLTQIFRSNSTTTNSQMRVKPSSQKPPRPSPNRTPSSGGKKIAATPSPLPPLRQKNGESTTPYAVSPSTQSDAFGTPSLHDQIPITYSAVKTPGSNPIIIQPENSPSASEKRQLAREQDPAVLASFFKSRSAKMLSPLGDPSKKRARNITTVDVNVNPLAKTQEEASEIPSNTPIDTVLNVPFSLSYGFEETLEVDLGCRASRVPLPYAINVFTFDLDGSIKPRSARLERDPDGKASMLVEPIASETVFSPVPDEDVDQTIPISDALEEASIVFWAAPDAHAEGGCDRFVLTVTDQNGEEYETQVEIHVRKTEPLIAVETQDEAPDVSRTETFIDFPTGSKFSEKSIKIWNNTEGGAPLLLNVLIRDVASGVFSIGRTSDDVDLCIPMYILSGDFCTFSAKFELIPEAAVDHEYYGFALIKYATILPSAVSPEDDAELYHAYDHVLNFTASSEIAEGAYEIAPPLDPEADELQEHQFCHPESILHPDVNCPLEYCSDSILRESTLASSYGGENSIAPSDSFSEDPGSAKSNGSKSQKVENVDVEPLPIHVSANAVEDVLACVSGQPEEHCRVFLHQPPKWVPGRDNKENTTFANRSSGRGTTGMKSNSSVAGSYKNLSVKDRKDLRSGGRSYVSSQMADRLMKTPKREVKGQKAVNEKDGMSSFSSIPNTSGDLQRSEALPVDNRLSGGSVMEKMRMKETNSAECENDLESTGASGSQPLSNHETFASLTNQIASSSADMTNATERSSELKFERRESPSAFEYGVRQGIKSPIRTSHQSFTTAASAEDNRKFFGLRRLAKNRKPKIKMPRSIRENGVRVRATCGSALLPLYNASSSSIHVNIEIKKYPGSNAAAKANHRMLALEPQQRMNVVLTRMSSNEGPLRIIVTGYLRGPIKLSTVYHVPLFVEESHNRVPAATGFAVDRPTITFYKAQSRFQYQSLRVLNGTFRSVPYKVWLADWKDTKGAYGDSVLKIISRTTGTVDGRKCLTVKLKFDSNHPAQYYRQMLYISMDNSTDKVPIFAYTGCSSILISLTDNGLFRAKNHGNRSGFIVLSGPEVDALDNNTEKLVLLPKEEKDLVPPYGSGTFIYTGDEIARSRFCRAVSVLPNAKREAGEEMSLFLGTFDREQESRRKEHLLWNRDTKHSLHYAGRLLGNNIRRYKYDPNQKRVISDSKGKNDCGWQASIDADGYVHIENYDTEKFLKFKCKGAEPNRGVIPPLGDAKLAAFLENVEVFARGSCMELFNERRFA
ncbi:hypothetical protein FGB62_1g534 [Gracilaria domingensis]|nr:hypothetical protein FGB62_1g534 [Gracilaria domingensis]